MILKYLLILATFFFTGSLMAFSPLSDKPDRSDKPNILVFIADDAGMDFGCYGNPYIKTPHIDQLAAEGLLFENAFLTTAQCSPSRTSILAGQFAHTIGTEDLHYPLNDNVKLLPHYLKQEGYYSGILMKQHLGKNGTDQFDHVKKGHDNKAPEMFEEFLGKTEGRPFFAWVAFHDPHRPYGGRHGAESVHQADKVVVSPYFVDTKETRQEIAQYYDEIHRMDRNIGAILAMLEDHGLRENTIVIFLSDNGMPFPRGKATAYDFGIKTPLIIQGKGVIDKGVSFDGLASVIDLAPTILDLAGIEKPAGMYGESIRNIFKDQSAKGRKYIFAERNWHDSDAHMRCIRSDRYKLIVNGYPERAFPITADYSRSDVWYDLLEAKEKNTLNNFQRAIFQFPRVAVELYDLKNDPYEINNLMDEREYVQIATDLNAVLLKWKSETNDYPSFKKRRIDMVDRKTGFFFNRGGHGDYNKYGYWGSSISPGGKEIGQEE